MSLSRRSCRRRIVVAASFVACVHSAAAFAPPYQRRQSITCQARPPPKNNFDLDAIEAFETKLDLEDSIISADGSEEETDSEGPASGDGNVKSDDVKKFIITPELNGERIDTASCAATG